MKQIKDIYKFFSHIGNEILESLVRKYNYIEFTFQKHNDKIVVFNTAENTDNLGDFIIMQYCKEYLWQLFKCNYINISTHKVPSPKEEEVVKETKYKFVCGTNLMTSHIEEWWNWRLPDGFRKKMNYRNVILLGVGWWGYQDECSDYSKLIYRSLLNPCILHSVRDHYTEKKLRAAGIKNVINTGCPTMWNLTPEFCTEIPCRKAENVITTLTDYRQDVKNDNIMLQILSENYTNIYLWLQGRQDEQYLKMLDLPFNVIIIPRDLEAYERRLIQGNVDYVGTRLHAGIFALNHKVRSIIVAVDNRAIEIAKDTNLPIVRRERIADELYKKINAVDHTVIKIPLENIKKFKDQFK